MGLGDNHIHVFGVGINNRLARMRNPASSEEVLADEMVSRKSIGWPQEVSSDADISWKKGR